MRHEIIHAHRFFDMLRGFAPAQEPASFFRGEDWKDRLRERVRATMSDTNEEGKRAGCVINATCSRTVGARNSPLEAKRQSVSAVLRRDECPVVDG